LTGNKLTAKQFAVEKHKVEEEVLKLHKENTPATIISKMLAERNINIAPLGINRWIKHRMARMNQSKELQLKNECTEIMINYKNEITNILDEVKIMKDQCKAEGDLKIYDKMIGRLFQGLELLAKLSGDIRGAGSVDINIIINEINKKAEYVNKKMRNRLQESEIIDVEAEIIKEDEFQINKLHGGKK